MKSIGWPRTPPLAFIFLTASLAPFAAGRPRLELVAGERETTADLNRGRKGHGRAGRRCTGVPGERPLPSDQGREHRCRGGHHQFGHRSLPGRAAVPRDGGTTEPSACDCWCLLAASQRTRSRFHLRHAGRPRYIELLYRIGRHSIFQFVAAYRHKRSRKC